MSKEIQIINEVMAEIMANAFKPFGEMGEKYGVTYEKEEKFLTTKEK